MTSMISSRTRSVLSHLVPAVLVAAGLAAGFPAVAAEQVLDAGAVHVVPASEASCFHDVRVANPGPSSMRADASCDDGRLRVQLKSGESVFPNKVDVNATSRFVTQFRVPAVAGAKEPSFLPVSVTVPVSWNGLLLNDNLIPNFAWANVNMYVRLREGDAAQPESQGRILDDFRFSGASHGGISKCLSVPTSAVSVGKTIATCAIGLLSQDSGSQTVTVSGVIQTERTYEIEVDLDGEIHTLNAESMVGAHPYVEFMIRQVGFDEPGVVQGDITLDIGSDAQKGLGDLQREIDQLRSDFEHHTHEYLTGRGVGQNNTTVDTGPPIVVSAPTPPAPPVIAPPVIKSATVRRTTGAGGSVVLSVAGTGFVSGSRVRWNGADRVTTYVDAAHLTAVLANSDIGKPGIVAVTVADPPPDTDVSAPYYFIVK